MRTLLETQFHLEQERKLQFKAENSKSIKQNVQLIARLFLVDRQIARRNKQK